MGWSNQLRGPARWRPLWRSRLGLGLMQLFVVEGRGHGEGQRGWPTRAVHVGSGFGRGQGVPRRFDEFMARLVSLVGILCHAARHHLIEG